MLCVIAKLNGEATETLAAIRKAALPDAVLTPLYGHITIATYTGDNEARFIRFCKSLLAGMRSFPVRYEKIAVLEATSIIVASPEKSGPLEALHLGIAEQYNRFLQPWTQIGQWCPHTTLLYGPGLDLHRICREMSPFFVPFSAKVSGIEFSRVLESGYAIVDSVALHP